MYKFCDGYVYFVLLGATKKKELVFAKFGITKRNSYPEFTACFNTVLPFNSDNFDIESYYECWIDGQDKSYLYDLCEQYDCAPSALAENLAGECYDVRDVLDCSSYPAIIKVNGENWCFESMSGGQHDTRDEMEEIINPAAYNELHELWDKFHLCKVGEDTVKQVEKLIEAFSNVDEKTWIVDYIERHMEDLEGLNVFQR